MDASDTFSEMQLRIGDTAPNFRARSTTGPVELKDYRGRWLVLFSHPADFTPVCTSEFIAFARAAGEFEAVGCSLMALSVDSLYSHFAWIRAIRDKFGVEIRFPILEDPTLVIGRAFGMIGRDASDATAVRSVFVIDPEGVVRARSCYPIEIGRNVAEILRMVQALQAVDERNGLAPEGWQHGDALFAQPEPNLDAIFSADDPVCWFLKEQRNG